MISFISARKIYRDFTWDYNLKGNLIASGKECAGSGRFAHLDLLRLIVGFLKFLRYF